MKNSLLKKFISFSIGGYIALLIGFFTTPIITRMLSPEQYGIASVFNLIVNILMLISMLGLDQGFVRYFYEEEDERRGKLLFNSLKYPMILFSVISILILVLSKKISLFLYNENNLNMIMLLIVMFLLTLLNRFSFLIVRMQQKAKLYSLFQVLNQLLNFILILILFKNYGDNYKTIIISSTVTMFLVTFFSIIAEKKIWSFKGQNQKTSSKELLKYSIPFTLTMALTWIFQSADKLIIKAYSDMNELGLYAAAFKIVALINIVQNGFTTFWVPVAYEKYQKNPEERKFFENVSDYISLLMFLMAIGVLSCKNLIILLLGEKFREASSIMPALVMMPIMYTISETTVLGINFKKKTKYHLWISSGVAIFNILGNLLLVPKFGAKGAAISTGLAYILFFTLRTYFSLKAIKFKFNLTRLYFLTFLIMGYSIYLSFVNNYIQGIIIGVILTMITILLYIPVLKNIYNEYLMFYVK